MLIFVRVVLPITAIECAAWVWVGDCAEQWCNKVRRAWRLINNAHHTPRTPTLPPSCQRAQRWTPSTHTTMAPRTELKLTDFKRAVLMDARRPRIIEQKVDAMNSHELYNKRLHRRVVNMVKETAVKRHSYNILKCINTTCDTWYTTVKHQLVNRGPYAWNTNSDAVQ